MCDHGLLLHPGAVTLVAGIRAPDPDQNQPWMFLGWRWGACAGYVIHCSGHLNAIFVLPDEIYRNGSRLQLSALWTFNAHLTIDTDFV